MPNDKSKKSSKKTNNQPIMKKKKNSDSDNDEPVGEVEEVEMDMDEFRKELHKIFPSKYLKNKINKSNKDEGLYNATNNEDKESEDDEDDDDDYDEEEDSEDDEEDEEDEESEWDSEDDSEEDEKENKKNKKSSSKADASKKKAKIPVKKNKKKSKEDEEDWETCSDESEEENPKRKKAVKNKGKINKNDKKIKKDKEEDKEEKQVLIKNKDIKKNKKNKNKIDVDNGESQKFNIIFTIGGQEDDYDDEYDDDDEYDEDEEEEISENEDDPVSSDSSSDEDEDEDEEDDESEEDKSHKMKTRSSTKGKNIVKKKQDKTDKTEEKKKIQEDNIQDNDKETNSPPISLTKKEAASEDVVNKLKEILNIDKDNKIAKKCLDICEKEMKEDVKKKEKKIAKTKAKNMRIFRKKVNDKNVMNDFTFYEKLEVEQQKKIIKELREINKITRVEKPYRMTLLESEIPINFKSAAMKKINSLRYMDPGSGEFYKIKNWIDTFMQIPFNKYNTLDVNIDNGVDACHKFMENARNTLNSAVYGLNDAKMQIMQMMGQLVTNPKSIGTAIAIHGPPGTGKTSLVKEGISKILNRPFAFIALGGATDSSYLEGHSYTYEGSTWGKIVQILIDSKCMNPVIYFDELDKISETPRGEEIAGILTHLTDTSQNSQFHDKYFAEIDFDLSKCLFIFSYNDESKVNPILKDRMYRIQTKGYDLKQKTIIGNEYLLPKIREQVKFENDEIIIPDDCIHHIIDNFCNKEDGVRNLKRCLEIVHTKLNLYRLMKPSSNLFEDDLSLTVSFPYTLTKEIIDKLIKKNTENISAMYSMYV